jgi:hypothetical protein
MDYARFDAVSRMLGLGTTRRGALGALLGVASTGQAADAAARRRRRRRCRKGKKRCGKRCVRGTCCPGKPCGTDCRCARSVEGDTVCITTLPSLVDPCVSSQDCDPFERCIVFPGGGTTCLSRCATP